MTQDLELLQFPYSHYNEKARWALDWKRLPHRRTSFLPGPHAPRIKRLTGRTQLPVLRVGGRLVPGSAAILEELERLAPDPPLLPAAPEERRRALELQRHFDEEVGPKVRRALFSILLHEPGYVCRIFAGERSLPVRAFYRATLPLAKGMMRRDMGLGDAEAVREAFEATRAAFELVAKQVGPSGHLVGDRFSVADLTAAALLAPAVMPEGSSMELPRPRPARVEGWLARWAGLAGARWVSDTFGRYRPRSQETR